MKERSNGGRSSNETLSELCACSDADFIDQAYQSILGRAADPVGRSHYLERLRTGWSKLTILQQLRQSAEGRKANLDVPGLEAALRRHGASTNLLIGWLVRLFTKREGDTRAERTQRAIANQLAVLAAEDPSALGSPLRQGQHSSFMAPAEIAMVDHLLMRMIRVEASLKRIEGRFKSDSGSFGSSSD